MPSLLLTRPSPSLPPAAFLRAARRGLPPVINMVMSMILGLTLFACVLGALPRPGLAEQSFLLKGFSLGGTDKHLEVNLRLALSEEHNLAYMLRDGAKMEMSCEVQLLRKRTFWSNELVAETATYNSRAYDLLLREFVLGANGQPPARNESFRRLMTETWENLSVPLDNPAGLEQDEDYAVKVTVALKHTEMPPWLTRSILFWSDEIITPTTFELDLNY